MALYTPYRSREPLTVCNRISLARLGKSRLVAARAVTQTSVAGRQEHIYEKDRKYVRRSQTRTGLRLGGRGQDLQTSVTDTDWIYGCLPASSFNSSVFLVLFVFLLVMG